MTFIWQSLDWSRTNTDLADELGVTPNYVSRHRAKYGKKWNVARKEFYLLKYPLVAARKKNKLKYTDLGRIYGRSYQAIQQIEKLIKE